MSTRDFGPVPVSRLKAESGAIFDALAQGRRVLVAKHDRVVALIDPSGAIPRDLLVDYVTPGGRRLAELTATTINQGSPSRAVAEASEAPLYVTKDNQVYGLLRGVTADELAAALPSPGLIAERERRIEEFLADTPEPTADELVTFGEELTAELGIAASPGDHVAPGLLDADGVQQLRERIVAAAHAYAEQAGALIPQPAAMGEEMHASLTHAIEVRVTEAMATATEETLTGFVTQKGRAFAELGKALDMGEERATKALDSLAQQVEA